MTDVRGVDAGPAVTPNSGRMRRGSAAFIWRDRALFLGDRSTTGVHDHYAIEISVALDDLGLSLTAPDGPSLVAVPGAVARAATPHRLDIPGDKVAVFYLDPASRAGADVQDWLGERRVAALPDGLGERVRPGLEGQFNRATGLPEAAQTYAGLLRPFTADPDTRVIDPRVDRIVALMESRPEDPPSLAEAARTVGLSENRLRLLFSAQVGVPMRRYLLWVRLRAALTATLAGETMTDAAHRAGFSDGAHFTRTCQRMFGLPPTAFTPVDDVFVAE